MKLLLYNFFKGLIRTGFFCYYQEISMHNLDRVPRDRAVMLLPNHQNALLDPLLYAAFARARKPYFLTRSDVFNNPLLRWIFEGLRMMPIYRLRDGRDTLKRNQEVFERCADLFAKGEHVLLFPEANHNLRRQVRPLSKGFTRILARSFQKYPDLDIWIVPVGVNYLKATNFPDRVAFYFGEAFSAKSYWFPSSESLDVPALREVVHHSLTLLTTHIPPQADYDESIQRLTRSGVDLLNPDATRSLLSIDPKTPALQKPGRESRAAFWGVFFHGVNLPVWLPWRWIAKNKVPEPEFKSTFRFLYALGAVPLYYLLVGGVLSLWLPYRWALAVVIFLFACNLAYVKCQPLGRVD